MASPEKSPFVNKLSAQEGLLTTGTHSGLWDSQWPCLRSLQHPLWEATIWRCHWGIMKQMKKLPVFLSKSKGLSPGHGPSAFCLTEKASPKLYVWGRVPQLLEASVLLAISAACHTTQPVALAADHLILPGAFVKTNRGSISWVAENMPGILAWEVGWRV